MTPSPSSPPPALKVSQLVNALKNCLESSFPHVVVEGEIFSFRSRNAAGHAYFDLKDESAQLSLVVFRGVFDKIPDPSFIRNGSLVRVTGRISVYPGSGRMQLVASSIQPAGEGALLLRLARLREKLDAEGLFDPARKRPLPVLPLRVGIVTSPTGAVIRDIQNTLARHDTRVRLLLAPARVQGEGAAAEIAAALDFLNALPAPPDLIVLARGGGSLEDLWCFNEETLVRAVARSRVPTVSAVGHQTDFTLCDFAADVRAETPTAAAELVARIHSDLSARIAELSRTLALHPSRRIAEWRTRFFAAAAPFAHPERVLEIPAQRLDHASTRILRALSTLPEALRRRVSDASRRLSSASAVRIERARSSLSSLSPRLAFALRQSLPLAKRRLLGLQDRLRLLDPRAVLARGYSLTRLPNGAIVRSPADAPPGTTLYTELAGGTLASVVAPTPEQETRHDPENPAEPQIRSRPPTTRGTGDPDGIRQPRPGRHGQSLRRGTDPDQGLLF